MKRIIRNFQLLSQDIKSKFKYTIYNLQNPNSNELFLKQNKKEVLLLYRHMLKNIPNMETNLFKKQCLYERIKFNFHEGSRETDPEVVLQLINTCYIVIEKINKGVYPPFPNYSA